MIDRIIKSDEVISFFSDKNFFMLLIIASGIFMGFLIIYIIVEAQKLKKEKKIAAESKKEEDSKNIIETEEIDDEATYNFEDEQEEKAIISYQELLVANQKKETKIELEEEEFLIEETIPLEEKIIEPKKFRNSEYISPVYGRISNFGKKEELVSSKKDVYLEEKSTEGEDFLKSLKEFRSKLD